MNTETEFEHDDEYYQQQYVDLVWQLGDDLVDQNNSLDRVSLILAAAGKFPYELERDVANYVKARDEREFLESIWDARVKERAQGWPVSLEHDHPGLLEALGRTTDDFSRDVLSEQIKMDQGY